MSALWRCPARIGTWRRSRSAPMAACWLGCLRYSLTSITRLLWADDPRCKNTRPAPTINHQKTMRHLPRPNQRPVGMEGPPRAGYTSCLPNLALWDQGAATGGAHVTARTAGSPDCDTDGLPLRFGRRSPGGPPPTHHRAARRRRGSTHRPSYARQDRWQSRLHADVRTRQRRRPRRCCV